MDHTYAVIMAGGSGTRLWPVSRKKHPKQTLPLLGNRTLFQMTVDRLDGFLSKDRIFIVTAKEQAEVLRGQTPEIPQDNFIIEPDPRGTASVIGLAATVLAKKDPDAVMIVLPSDHYIRNVDLFRLVMRVAVDVAGKNYLVTLGITPTSPATGYGYIQRGEPLSEQFDYPAYHVKRFKEKPEQTGALEMLRQIDHSWNSGMFIWRADVILKEFARLMPRLKVALDRIGVAWGTAEQETVLRNEWMPIRSETIDYGVMEFAERVAVLPASDLGWNDIGNWDSLFDVLIPNETGNIVFRGKHKEFDTSGSLIYGNGDDRLVVTVGVQNLIVVDNGNVLLICHKNHAQKVRDVVNQLIKQKEDRYL
jgi:mannose-1-phosphate guanylyltransferase